MGREIIVNNNISGGWIQRMSDNLNRYLKEHGIKKMDYLEYMQQNGSSYSTAKYFISGKMTEANASNVILTANFCKCSVESLVYGKMYSKDVTVNRAAIIIDGLKNSGNTEFYDELCEMYNRIRSKDLGEAAQLSGNKVIPGLTRRYLELKEEQGITQGMIAEALGVESVKSLRTTNYNVSGIRMSRALEYADIFKISPDYILGTEVNDWNTERDNIYGMIHYLSTAERKEFCDKVIGFGLERYFESINE